MIDVGGDPDLEHARRQRPDGAATVDEVFCYVAHFGDVVVSGDEAAIRQDKQQRLFRMRA
jgi:hypothetical protein